MIDWDEYYPTVYEVNLAGKIFKNAINEIMQDVLDGSMSKSTAIDIAVSEVWTSAKKWQDNNRKAISIKHQANEITST